MFTKYTAASRLKEIFVEYGHLLSKDPRPLTSDVRHLTSVIHDLMQIVVVVDVESRSLVSLAHLLVDEAKGFEQAVMTCPEGREMVSHLKCTRPELFHSWVDGHA